MLSELSIVTAVCGQNETTFKWIETTLKNCDMPVQLIIVSNGSSEADKNELDDYLNSNLVPFTLCHMPTPVGTSKAFNIGASLAHGPLIAMLHNDLYIYQRAWGKLLLRFYKRNPKIGVCGFVGAKTLGMPGLYKEPYDFSQLARANVYSCLTDWQIHGKHIMMPERVVVLDGCALILTKTVFEEVGGFDLKYVHHMYDNDLSLRVHFAGYRNFVLPISCWHRGGMTSTAKEYNEWATKNYNSDLDIHRKGHEYFYEKWRGKIPVSV